MGVNGTHLIAFWDGKSRGTKNMIETMKKMNKPVRVIMNNLEKSNQEIEVNLAKIQAVFKNPHLLHSTHYLEMWIDDKEHGKFARETLLKTKKKLKSIGMTEYEFNNVVDYLNGM
jgi:hypothetical protein